MFTHAGEQTIELVHGDRTRTGQRQQPQQLAHDLLRVLRYSWESPAVTVGGISRIQAGEVILTEVYRNRLASGEQDQGAQRILAFHADHRVGPSQRPDELLQIVG